VPLSHITVIDLCHARSGPTCIRQLAELGANVIKVEPPVFQEAGTGARHDFDFQNLHPNKRSLTLNLKTAAGRAVLLRLVERADVFVENFRPDVKVRLEIDYETLAAINPRLVYASISGFGEHGPYRDRAGVDQIGQGMSGLMSVTGEPGRGPMRVGVAVADQMAGYMAAHGIMAALLERERSGRGQWVHTSLLQATIRLMEFQAARWLIDGEVPGQAGNHHPVNGATGVYRAKSGSLIIQAVTERLFGRLCETIGAPELMTDPRFTTSKRRKQHEDELTEALERRLAARDADEWVDVLAAAGVPAGPVLNVRECFENEQVQALPMVCPVEHPLLGTLNLLGAGVNLERTPPRIHSPAPELGQHTDEVLTELGYTTGEIQVLRQAGSV
jgi:crotonobetainyl-CoA:carnitine CoA-transferase CaiB-like acyl-CoA transferase